MQVYKCRCGHSEWHGPIRQAPCTFCPKCGTQLGTYINEDGTEEHRPPVDHDWVIRYDEKTGEPYKHCMACLEKVDA